MEELYIQNYGEKRIVCLISYNDDEVLLEDIKTEVRYILNWNIFLKHHMILQDYEVDVISYSGPDLDLDK